MSKFQLTDEMIKEAYESWDIPDWVCDLIEAYKLLLQKEAN